MLYFLASYFLEKIFLPSMQFTLVIFCHFAVIFTVLLFDSGNNKSYFILLFLTFLYFMCFTAPCQSLMLIAPVPSIWLGWTRWALAFTVLSCLFGEIKKTSWHSIASKAHTQTALKVSLTLVGKSVETI